MSSRILVTTQRVIRTSGPRIGAKRFSSGGASTLSSSGIIPRHCRRRPCTSFQIVSPLVQPTTIRFFSRSSQSTEKESPESKAKTFLMDQVGHSAEIAQGVVSALQASGVSGLALLEMVRSMAGRYEVGEDAGLEALVEAVRLDLARQQGKEPITLYCIPANAWKSSEDDAPDFSPVQETPEERAHILQTRAWKIEAMTGLSLTDVAKFGDGQGAQELGASIECACAGIMACSTCHVVIDPEWYGIVGEPSEAEQDMLDLAYAPRATSRLGCQIQLSEDMNGMVIRLPRAANNIMDDIPFED